MGRRRRGSKRDLGAAGPELDPVTHLDRPIAPDSLSVEEGPVAAAEIPHQVTATLLEYRGVTDRDGGIALRIDRQIGPRVASDRGEVVANDANLPRSGAVAVSELGVHGS